MKVVYKTKNTCASEIKFDFDETTKVINNVVFTNGCNGNLQAVSKLVDGLDAETILKKVQGIKCGRKDTSCADQLAAAITQVINNPKNI